MALDNKFQSILWEYELSKLNLDDDIVCQRVLSLWNKEITDFWIKKLWKKLAKKLFLKNQKYIDKKSVNYWNIIFGIQKTNLKDNKTMYEKLNKPIFSRSFG